MPARPSRLKHEPASYDPFALIRLLESTDFSSPRVGRSLKPAEDPLAFGQPASLAFASSSIAGIVEQGPRPKVLVHMFGLLGTNGPLPLHLTEYIDDRARNHHDTTLQAFCDLLTNRMAALFYRAWAVNQPAVAHDRSADDRFSFYLRCILGLGTDGLQSRDAVPDSAKLYMASRLRQLPNAAESLESMIGDWFGLPCRIEQLVGQWLAIPESGQTRMGLSPETGALGKTTVVGSRVWDVQGRFRIHLGPMSLAQYERLLPGREGMEQLCSWVKLQSGLEYTWDVRPVLREEQVPGVTLGESGMLGQTTWLGSGGRDRDDLILEPVA